MSELNKEAKKTTYTHKCYKGKFLNSIKYVQEEETYAACMHLSSISNRTYTYGPSYQKKSKIKQHNTNIG